MNTEYCCSECGESFTDQKLPNLNRRHHCGALARIIKHEGGSEGDE